MGGQPLLYCDYRGSWCRVVCYRANDMALDLLRVSWAGTFADVRFCTEVLDQLSPVVTPITPIYRLQHVIVEAESE